MPSSRAEPDWLSPAEIVSLNVLEVGASRPPEPHVLIDEGKLLGALARPTALFHYGEVDDVAQLGSCLLFAIARSHAFLQGNKRTGFTAFVLFLRLNGFDFTAPDTRALGELVERVVAGKHNEDAFAELVRSYIVPMPDDEA